MVNITVLSENSSNDSRLSSQNGLSFEIFANGHHFLMDVGQSDVFLNNSLALNHDLSNIEFTIISHGHFDHGGGLKTLWKLLPKNPVYIRRTADAPYYLKILFIWKYVGLDSRILRSKLNNVIWIDQSKEIVSGIFLLTEIESIYPKPIGNKYLFQEINGKKQLDSFIHEQILVIKESDGLTIITGCSHNGILNMIASVKSRFPNTPIKGVIGGFHLIGNPLLKTPAISESDILQIAETLKSMNCGKIYTGHCTGKIGFNILKSVLGVQLNQISTGMNITL
jgi:7,8-dihydropterin-6-yl-methyl-4-(beta-D-ribofuranosyl)aminobenzene 5'-phosphate synthase